MSIASSERPAETKPAEAHRQPFLRGKTLLSRLLIEFHDVDDRPVAAFDLAEEGPRLADFMPAAALLAAR